jgi:formamidopyrimidine-DNA glycosylase
MPELPEVEAWVRELDPLVSAAPIERAGPAHIATLKTFDPPLSALDGRRLEGAERRGKNLLFPVGGADLVVRVHLMSAGRLRYLAPSAKGPKTPMFRLRFAGGSERRQLHPLLRNQRAMAGIGRAHANEILLRAKLSPFKATADMSPDETERLAAAIRVDLERALELRLAGKGDKAVYRVHNRLGEPCPECGTPIARVDYEEHTVYYCPTCQTGGRVLKDRRLSRLLR